MWFVGHAIDFCIALNCIACANDYLLVKCSLWSFFNNCFYMIKLCYMFPYLVFFLIAFYLFSIHAMSSTCLVLNAVYLLCASVSGYRCIWFKCFTTFRFRCEWVLPLFPNSCLSLEFFKGFCHGIAKGEHCKVVISK